MCIYALQLKWTLVSGQAKENSEEFEDKRGKCLFWNKEWLMKTRKYPFRHVRKYKQGFRQHQTKAMRMILSYIIISSSLLSDENIIAGLLSNMKRTRTSLRKSLLLSWYCYVGRRSETWEFADQPCELLHGRMISSGRCSKLSTAKYPPHSRSNARVGLEKEAEAICFSWCCKLGRSNAWTIV